MTNSASATRAGETAKTAAQWRVWLTAGSIDTKRTGDHVREGLACMNWGEQFFATGSPSLAKVAAVGVAEAKKVTTSMRLRQVACPRCEAPFRDGLRETTGLWYGDDGPGLHFKPGGT
jgi:hypothetical protein